MSGLEIAAQVGRRQAESAPQNIRPAQQEIAAFNDELIARLKQRSPKTIADLQAALSEADAALKRKYSNYDRDSQDIKAFDHTNCGLEDG